MSKTLGQWRCACGAIVDARARACAECGIVRPPAAAPAPRPAYGPPPGPERRTHIRCPLHHVVLDGTGYCAVAQAWWVPKFACPQCAGPLWDNGACPNCTPKTGTFPGDYFEQRWDALAGREYGHSVRVAKGPTPAPSAAEVAGYFAELRAAIGGIGRPIDATRPAPLSEATPRPSDRASSGAPPSPRRPARGFAVECRTPNVIGYRCLTCRHEFGREPSAPVPTACPRRACPTHGRARVGALNA